MKTLAGAAALLLGLPAAAVAQGTDPQAAVCALGSDESALDRVIGACTTLIESPGAAPDNLQQALATRGIAYTFRRDYPRARADLDRAITLNPQAPLPFFARANLFHQLGDLARAIADYSEVIRLGAPSAQPYFWRGSLYLAQRENQRAIADFSEAIRLQPQAARNHAGRGRARFRYGEYDGAIADYGEAIRLEPGNTEYFRGRGLARQYVDDEQGAVADYSEAIRLNPRDARAFSLRGNAYHQLNDTAHAMADYREALSLDPRQTVARRALCQILAEAGTPSEGGGCDTEGDVADARVRSCRLLTEIDPEAARTADICRPLGPQGR